MARADTIVDLGFVRLDARRSTPLFRQLYDSLRDAILDGRLPARSRIPSSRDLVKQLGVSRTTVVTAVDQLTAEGYLQSVKGSGTFVSSEIPADSPFSQPQPVRSRHRRESSLVSSRGQIFAGEIVRHPEPLKPFLPGVPALDQFPVDVWAQLTRRMWKELTREICPTGNPAATFHCEKI